MPRTNVLIGIGCLVLSEAAMGQTCTITFDGACPTAVADQCGAFFDGGGGCVFAGLANCYDTGIRSYKVTTLAPLTITIPVGLDALEVFFAGQGTASGEMRFFDAQAGGNEVDAPMATNGDCLLLMPPHQTISFTSVVHRIEVIATGGTVWIDTFIATPHPDCGGLNNCSGNGTCVASNTCQCDAGWSAVDCSGSDCNNNGVADDVDIINCMGSPDCLDGNANGIPDVCELAPPLPEDSLGITNCVLDSECAKEAYCVPDAVGEFPGTCYVPKNRYLSIAPNPTNGVPSARRLTVVTFDRSCGGAGNTACISDSECAGSPDGTTCDDVRTGTQVIGWFGLPDADGYTAVVEEASRHYATWTNFTFPMECGVDELCPTGAHCDVGVGAGNTCRFDVDDAEVPSTVVHLAGCHIAPKTRDARPGMNENRAANYYLIEAISGGADLTVASNYSPPLELRTVVVWADMTGGTQNNIALPPDGEPGFLNILHQVNRFKSQGKATTAWLDLDPQEPDHDVGFLDMLLGVAGFKGVPYFGSDPCSCAGLSPCH